MHRWYFLAEGYRPGLLGHDLLEIWKGLQSGSLPSQKSKFFAEMTFHTAVPPRMSDERAAATSAA